MRDAPYPHGPERWEGYHPGAVRDVADLVGLLRSWHRDAGLTRERTSGRLEAVLVAAERRTPPARDLVAALSELDAGPVARRRRPGPVAARADDRAVPRTGPRVALGAAGSFAVPAAAGLAL